MDALHWVRLPMEIVFWHWRLIRNTTGVVTNSLVVKVTVTISSVVAQLVLSGLLEWRTIEENEGGTVSGAIIIAT